MNSDRNAFVHCLDTPAMAQPTHSNVRLNFVVEELNSVHAALQRFSKLNWSLLFSYMLQRH